MFRAVSMSARTGDLIARKMIEEEKIREDYARSLIRELK